MAAITNGIALDGTLRPYCGTFLIFSDYLRPSLRLAALMGLPSLFVFTHDSIYLGEDGPTHQPIEHLDALRAIPNVTCFARRTGSRRPPRTHGSRGTRRAPRCSRSRARSCPRCARAHAFSAADVARGAYAVRDPANAQVVLVASGSEVSLACDAAEKLHAENVAARVVSLPCLELFYAQPASWRDELIPAERVPVVAIEAARGQSLRGLVGTRGFVYGTRPLRRIGAVHGARRVLRVHARPRLCAGARAPATARRRGAESERVKSGAIGVVGTWWSGG